MSSNSSRKKNCITSLDEYDQLSQLHSDAWDRVQSGGTGAGYSGIHYEVFEVLRKYGRVANGRDEALAELKKLLREYEIGYLGTKEQSDEEYLSKFDDLE
jgi:hypothetical protein